MASSVPSEAAGFSSAGVTITKRRNRLKGDVVEALQVLKGAYREDFFPTYLSMALEEKLAAEEEEEEKLINEVDAEAKELELDDDCKLDANVSDDDFSQLT